MFCLESARGICACCVPDDMQEFGTSPSAGHLGFAPATARSSLAEPGLGRLPGRRRRGAGVAMAVESIGGNILCAQDLAAVLAQEQLAGRIFLSPSRAVPCPSLLQKWQGRLSLVSSALAKTFTWPELGNWQPPGGLGAKLTTAR